MSNYRSPLRIIRPDFRAGELDPNAWMRIDSKAYPAGAQSLRNCQIYNTGAVTRRPGSRMLKKLAARSWLEPFDFDADEKYVLAFQVNALAIYNADGLLLQTFSGASTCPWTQKDGMTFEQSGDLGFICNRAWQTRVITRTGLSSFSISLFDFEKAADNNEVFQPYVKFARPEVTLTVSTYTVGTGRTITASAAVFKPAHVGTIIRIFKKEILITAYTSPTQVTGTIRKQITATLDPNAFRSAMDTYKITVTHAFHGMATGTTILVADAGQIGMDFDYTDGITAAQLNGTKTITVEDEDHYYFQAETGDNARSSEDGGGTAVKISSVGPHRDWDEAVFSPVHGWPGAVVFHEDRLWFGGSTDMPDGIWSSHTGRYYRFDVKKALADASIQKSIGFASIRHMVSNRTLQIFTENAEVVASQTDNSGLTPDNTVLRKQTPYGASYVTPLVFDGATLFIQKNSKTVREFLFDYSQDAFVAGDMTVVSQHLINAPIDFDVCYGIETRPEQYAFFVNGDGTMAVFHSIRQEELAAWVPWVTRAGDKFDSVVALHDVVFVSVLRNGFYWLERIDFDADLWLDFCKVMSVGSPQTVWALGADYANKTVKVTSGDYYVGEYTANGAGTITLEWPVSSIVAGFDYEWKCTPMPPDEKLSDGVLTGRERRIAATVLHVRNTLSLTINGMPIVVRTADSDISEPPVRLEGKYRHFHLGHSRDPVVELTQGEPLPVTILGMVMEVSV